jgi:hypothetical protein
MTRAVGMSVPLSDLLFQFFSVDDFLLFCCCEAVCVPPRVYYCAHFYYMSFAYAWLTSLRQLFWCMFVCSGTHVSCALLKLINSIVFRNPLNVSVWSRYTSFDLVIFGLETDLQAASVLLLERTYFWSSEKCVNYLNTFRHDRVVSLNL